jgi:hypothetical protein
VASDFRDCLGLPFPSMSLGTTFEETLLTLSAAIDLM